MDLIETVEVENFVDLKDPSLGQIDHQRRMAVALG